MKINRLFESNWFNSWFKSKCFYFSGCFYKFVESGLEKSQNAPVELCTVIVSRRFYSEEWQTYPAVSLKELKEILKLQAEAFDVKPIYTFVENEQQDGFDVRCIQFNPEVSQLVPGQAVIVAETIVLEWLAKERAIYELDTPAGVLFFSNSLGINRSAFKQGMMKSSSYFKYSVGLPEDTPVLELGESDYARALWEALGNIPLHSVPKLVSFDVKTLLDWRAIHALYIAPLLTACVFTGIMHGFYSVKEFQLDEKLSSYGADVEKVLDQKQAQEKKERFVTVTKSELESLRPIHSDWQLAYEAIKSGMEIQQFRMNANELVMRGFADEASGVLEAMNNLDSVESVVFDGPVRKSGRRDYFIMNITLSRSSS
ncbi:hypothetical protein W04_1117 [Pseudoalteromonas sp. SW0106-04]|uniref:hypothetical protein n=1 Tax=Pseudoalteromonas sp. SW0106-04 TaxID=1702169 RepID=UPI0006B3FFAE|nr:hypothetical protein [Pseudoalteromonas sp. SW0106-04]GAP74601.1 hypothetical protein W04_1117 [Pseudoalteromonas sp. SW0106-04]